MSSLSDLRLLFALAKLSDSDLEIGLLSDGVYGCLVNSVDESILLMLIRFDRDRLVLTRFDFSLTLPPHY